MSLSEKRRDHHGRLLRTGESQRQDGSYMYRYTDLRGKRRTLYAPDLPALRAKEQTVQRDRSDGIDYAAGEISVNTLIQRYVAQKRGVRENTKVGYQFVVNLMSREDFGYRQIRDVKPSEAKAFFIKLHEDGYSYSTISTIRGVLKPAFDMAVEDDVVRRNPFSFRTVDVVPNDAVAREALTPEEKQRLLDFLEADACGQRYRDEVVILLGTGLRISELYGLTIADADLPARRIRVERQLARTRSGDYYVERPKTKSGVRFIPMSDLVYDAFQRVIRKRRRPRVEYMVGGHTGFLFLDKEGKPKVAGHLEHALKRLVDKYNRTHDDRLAVTPHVLRHTFCTEMAAAGVDLKSLQYLMGHSDAYTTLNIYTHSSYENAKAAMEKAAASS
jgi:integrase